VSTFLQYTVNGLSISAVYILVGVGLTLIYGVARLVNFAQGQILALGTYVGYALVNSGIPFALAIPLATVGVALLGGVLYRFTLRRLADDAMATFLVTLGLGIVIQQTIVKIWGPRQKSITTSLSDTIRIGDVSIQQSRLLLFVVGIPVLAGLFVLLARSDLGRSMRAAAEDPDTATLLGIDVRTTMTVAFMLGSALAALAGVLLGAIFPFTPFTGDAFLIKGLAVALAGGLGSVPGAAIMGLALGMGETYAAGYGIHVGFIDLGPEWRDGYAFILMIALLAWRPKGLLRGTGAT
jgi:branched-subunit amino acid ABC-type transport system permease component